MTRLTFFTFAALISLGICQQCSEGWTSFQGDCYGYGNTATSWANAQVICQSHSATLVEGLAKEDNDFVTAIARNKNDDCVWIGATDIFEKGNWKWSNSLDFGSFVNWGSGEPNNINNDENCLNLHRSINYQWNDDYCNKNCNFICVTLANDHLPTDELKITT